MPWDTIIHHKAIWDCFFWWNISVIFAWNILVTETFWSFISQFY